MRNEKSRNSIFFILQENKNTNTTIVLCTIQITIFNVISLHEKSENINKTVISLFE